MKILMIIPSVSKKWGGTATSVMNFYNGLIQHSNTSSTLLTTLIKNEKDEASNAEVQFENLEVDFALVECFQNYHNLKLFTRIGYFLKKYGGHKMAKKLVGVLR